MRKKKAIIGIYIFYMLAVIPETKTQRTDSHRTVNIENNQEIKKKNNEIKLFSKGRITVYKLLFQREEGK